MLEWVGIPFSRESSQPRDGTHVSYISCIGSLQLAIPGKPGVAIYKVSLKKKKVIEMCRVGEFGKKREI